jgi:nickel-dependent lactate racemase
MEFHIPFGRSFKVVCIPDRFGVDLIEAPETPSTADPMGIVRSALGSLLGNMAWTDFAGARSVAIAVSDKTRPVPHGQLLPPLLERLAALGIPDTAITFYVAVGTHPPMSPDEFPAILPADILKRYRVVSHDSEDDGMLVDLGATSRGTPVWSNRGYVQSDFKIVIGNIEPHQFEDDQS